MAINPLIPLQARGPDIGAAFQNALMNVQNLQGMQQRAQQAQQTSQANDLAMKQATLKQMVTIAPAVSQAAQAGDIRALTQLAAQLPPAVQQEYMERVNLGDFSGIDAQAQRLSKLAPQMGIGGQRAGLASAKTQTYDNGTTLQAMPDGTTIVRNPAGQIVEGDERLNVLRTARQEQVSFAGDKSEAAARGKADVELETSADIAQRKKFGEMTGASRAKAIDSGFERVQKIEENISNLDRAIEAVQQGAGTGAIERRFPSIKAASVLLDQVQGQLALDVVGSVTFGALSEGELDLAKQVALPAGLEGPALVEWLTNKKNAQQKLSNYFQEQIDHLDQGGTVASFLRMKRRQSQGGSGHTPTNQGQQSNPRVIRFDAQGNMIQ